MIRIGGFYTFAGGEFPRSQRCLQPRITAAGYRAFIDDELIPNALRQQPEYTVFAYCGGFPEDPDAALELDDIEQAIAARLNVSFDELKLGCQDYEEAIGHRPLLYMGSIRAWIERQRWESGTIPRFVTVMERRNIGVAGFVWDEGAVYRFGHDAAALLTLAGCDLDYLEHWAEPRPTRGSIASVSPNLPCLCLAHKWRSSGGAAGDADHVPLADLQAAGCEVAVIDSGDTAEYHASLLRQGVGVALGAWNQQTGPELIAMASSAGDGTGIT